MMKRTSVATLCAMSPMGGLIVSLNKPLREVIAQFALAPQMHSIFLVNEAGRFGGAINNRDLLDWARLQFNVYPDDYKMSVHHVRRLLQAETIGDLARTESDKMSVRLTDTVEEALQVMAHYDLEDIAVLAEDGRIANDLRLSELLRFALDEESLGA